MSDDVQMYKPEPPPKPAFIPNEFAPNQGHLRPACPYKLTNGNYGFYFPTRIRGIKTLGRKLVLDLRTSDLRKAQERIDASGLWLQLATAKRNF